MRALTAAFVVGGLLVILAAVAGTVREAALPETSPVIGEPDAPVVHSRDTALGRILAKEQIVRDLVAGRLDLPAAVRRVRELYVDNTEFLETIRTGGCPLYGDSQHGPDGEIFARNLIIQAESYILFALPDRGEEILTGLETEFAYLVAEGIFVQHGPRVSDTVPILGRRLR